MDFRQGSDEWLTARSRAVTSTSGGSIEGKNPFESAQEWAFKKVRSIKGFHEDLSHIPAVAHGTATEPVAIEWFEKEWGLSGWDQPFETHRDHDWMISSIDRRWGLKTGGEIKCPYPKFTKEPYSVFDKPHYLIQCRHHMEVCDLDKLYFICYLSPDKFHIDELTRDHRWLDEMLPGKLMPTPRGEDVRRVDLYHTWLNYVLDEAADPSKHDYYTKEKNAKYKDVQDTDLDELQRLLLEDQKINESIEPQVERKAEIKTEIDKLKKSIGGKYEQSVTNGTVRFQIVNRKGTVDYAAAFEAVNGEDLLAVDGKRPDDFRRATTKQITISMEEENSG